MDFVNYVRLKQYLAIQQKFYSKVRDLTEISDTEQGIEAYYKFDLLKDILEYIECIEMNEDDFNHSQNILQQIEDKREALIQQFEKETDADGEEYDDAS
jgi:hypothetical protein|tara:strand:+ start:264 stop:560 length:297 start_codon:yes stop_codon:yes gene_type:complete